MANQRRWKCKLFSLSYSLLIIAVCFALFSCSLSLYQRNHNSGRKLINLIVVVFEFIVYRACYICTNFSYPYKAAERERENRLTNRCERSMFSVRELWFVRRKTADWLFIVAAWIALKHTKSTHNTECVCFIASFRMNETCFLVFAFVVYWSFVQLLTQTNTLMNRLRINGIGYEWCISASFIHSYAFDAILKAYKIGLY